MDSLSCDFKKNESSLVRCCPLQTGSFAERRPGYTLLGRSLSIRFRGTLVRPDGFYRPPPICPPPSGPRRPCRVLSTAGPLVGFAVTRPRVRQTAKLGNAALSRIRRLAQEEIAIACRRLGILVNGDNDCLHMLIAPAFPRGQATRLFKRLQKGCRIALIIEPAHPQ